jgi:hypothetical protein
MQNVYKAKGFADRNDYLRDVAANYGFTYKTVRMLADMLGEIEDFDGLISHLNEIEVPGVEWNN